MARWEVLFTAGTVLALLTPLGSTVQAQEPADAPVVVQSLESTIQVLTDQPRARLGLYLDANCVRLDAAALCDRPPVVVSVVEDGPADRAGVRQQDTLVALDGSPLSTLEGRLALQSLESGTAVLLSVAGPEGRRLVEVVPAGAPQLLLLAGRRLAGRGFVRRSIEVSQRTQTVELRFGEYLLSVFRYCCCLPVFARSEAGWLLLDRALLGCAVAGTAGQQDGGDQSGCDHQQTSRDPVPHVRSHWVSP